MACFFTLKYDITSTPLTSDLIVIFKRKIPPTLYGFFLLGICACQKLRGCSAFCSQALRKKTKENDPTTEPFGNCNLPKACVKCTFRNVKSNITSKYQLAVLHISAQSSAASGCKVGHFLLPPLPLHPLRHLHRRHRHPRHPPPPLPPHHGNLTMKSAVITHEIRILQI